MRPKIVLFLCTGNYYRSRFAELLFNHFAAQLDLDWLAISRGLALERGVNNIGPISPDAVTGLDARGVALEGELRTPLALDEKDLKIAHHIIAVNSAEHLPILQRKFPHHVEQVEFWDVYDRDLAMPDQALAQLERNIVGLISHLHMSAHETRPAVESVHRRRN
jgi:protein-tyrosine phosphatase